MTRSALSLKPQPDEPDEREIQRHAFLKHHAKSLMALPSDCSIRRYFRFSHGLLMDAPPPENPAQFIKVAEYLRNLGFSTPQILNHDLNQGFISIEDFGDATYTKLLQAGEDPYPLYNIAVDTLVALHKQADLQPSFIEFYDVAALLKEAELLVDWYIPYVFQKKLSDSEKQSYFDLWSTVFEEALAVPHSLVLRDYHVDNLMRLKDRPGIMACGLLDFQDALWGPVVYDFVSLVEDARLDLDAALVEHCWQRYLATFPEERQSDLRNSATILSAGRHAKILGIFTRQAMRYGNTKYLQHIPRIQRLLHNCLQHPKLHELKHWFDQRGIFKEWRE